jgi:hypothetical protein
LGGQQVEVDIYSAAIVYLPLSPLNGRLVVPIPGGLPDGFVLPRLQCAMIDPTLPGGLRLSASLSLEVRDDLETLSRNWLDAFSQLGQRPFYADAVTSSTFRFRGARRTMGTVVPDLSTLLTGEGIVRLEYHGLGRDSFSAAQLPTSAPWTGASVTHYVEFTAHRLDSCGVATTDRSRVHGLVAVEEGGSWRFDGDQRDAELLVYLDFSSGSTAGGLDFEVSAQVIDRFGRNGGVVSAQLCGPQINCASLSPLSVSGVNAWLAEVPLASPPATETPGGLPDIYTLTVNWAAAPTSTHTFRLRAPADPRTTLGRSLIAAAVPSPTQAPTVSLTFPFTTSAQISASFSFPGPLGSPLGAAEGTFSASGYNRGAGTFFLPALPVDRSTPWPTVTACIPFMSPGPTTFYFVRSDIFGNGYYVDLSGTL